MSKIQGITVVGITGRSGSGKSSLTAHYASLGYPVADGDALSRAVTEKGSDCLKALVEAFGEGILAGDGTLLRKKLGQIAFATPENNQTLIDITHPYILRLFLDKVEAAKGEGATLFFIDGAMIIGGIFEPYCDKLVVVTAEQRLSISRIVLRDDISKVAAAKRLDAQLPEEALCAKADYILPNNGNEAQMRALADDILGDILQSIQNDKQ